MSFLKSLFAKVDSFVHSDKAKSAEQTVISLMPVGMAIAQEIRGATPNRTLDEINKIASKYALPALTSLSEGQNVGNVLLNLGSQILIKNHAPTAGQLLANTVMQNAAFAVANDTQAPHTSVE